MSVLKRVRDLAFETAIAITIVVGLILYASRPHTGSEATWHFVPLVLNTVVVFGFVLSWYRHCWRKASLWAAIGSLLLVHSVGYIVLLNRVERFPLSYYVLFNSMEWAIIIPAVRALIGESPRG
jgi:multisubunit Na+/H+ antiporter MnhB subunit